MSVRRFRSGSHLEPSSREIPDPCLSLGRIFTRIGSRQLSERAARNWRKIRFEPKIESIRRPRSSSFSVLSEHEHHLKQQMRRSSVSRHTHRHGLQGLPVRAWSPVYSYLPGVAVGYKRLWMQDNPWPDHSSKDTGSKREGGQEYLHRMKFREHRRPHHEDFVPGGNRQDPLNLRATGLDDEVPLFSSSPVPAPEPDRYMPVNNFIPINQRDPLGLTQDEDNQMPVALKYPLRPKRKRSRCKKKDANVGGDASASQAIAECVEDTVPSDRQFSDTVRDVGDLSDLRGATSEDSSVMQLTNPEKNESYSKVEHADENEGRGVDSALELKLAVHEILGGSETFSESVDSNSGSKVGTSVNQAVIVSVESCSNLGNNNGKQQSTSEASNKDDDNVNAISSRVDNDHHTVFDDRINTNNPDGVDSDAQELRKRGTVAHPRNRSTGHQQSKYGSEPSRKLKHELDQKLKELQKTALSRKNLYPIPQSPLDDEDKEHVARNRKSLKKALRIEPIKPEEQAKVNKEREKKDREFKRLRRYPNLKSPEDRDDEGPSGSQLSEALKIDINLPPEKTTQGAQLLQGQPSRTVDSIVSPVLRPDPSQIRKRRRTISECSSESAYGASKKLVFRRSSSPDVRSSHPSPRKMRRQNSGSGQTEQKTSSEENQRSAVKFAKNPAYKHGNYYRYYGYRTPAMAPDFRLYYFRKEWFEGKDVLDVGCNAGDVTLAVAQLFHPQKIVGMDIDPNLIRIARQNIRSHQTKANMYQMEKYPVSANEYGPIEPLPALTNPSNIFPKNVMFMQGNYVLKSDEELDHVKGEYDTILALSITKWIHLNHGDEGLKRVFHRMFQQLRPGGKLVLEPQTWASYRRRKKLSATIYKNYNSIQLKPNKFADYLVNSVGFCKREFLGQPFNPSKGFQRPLWLFTKYIATAENTPSPDDGSNIMMMEPPPAQYTINERMTFLAGYSPYHSMPDFHGNAVPCTSSPAMLYHSRHAADKPYPKTYYPPMAASTSYSEFYGSPWGEESGAMYHEDSVTENQDVASAHTATSSQRETGESFNSTDSSASSSCLNASHTSTDSPSCSSHHLEHNQSSVQDRPDESNQEGGVENEEGMMDWQEAEQVNEDVLGQDHAEPELFGQEEESVLCNGDVNSDLPEEQVSIIQYSPDLSPADDSVDSPVASSADTSVVVGDEPATVGDSPVGGDPFEAGTLDSSYPCDNPVAMESSFVYEPGAEMVALEAQQDLSPQNPSLPSDADSMQHELPAQQDSPSPVLVHSSLEAASTLAFHEAASVECCDPSALGRVQDSSSRHLSSAQEQQSLTSHLQHPEVSSSQEGIANLSSPFNSSVSQALANPSLHGDNMLTQEVAGSSHEEVSDMLPQVSTQAAFQPQPSSTHIGYQSLQSPDVADLPHQVTQDSNDSSEQAPQEHASVSPHSPADASATVSELAQPLPRSLTSSDSTDPSFQPDSSLPSDTVD